MGKDLAVIVVQQVYFGTGKTFKDRVYCFQCEGWVPVWGKPLLFSIFTMDEKPRWYLHHHRQTLIGYRGAFKLCKYLFIRFAKGVGQNIESSPVCHAYNHFFYLYLHLLLCGWWHQGRLLWFLRLLMKISLSHVLGMKKSFQKITAPLSFSSVLLFWQLSARNHWTDFFVRSWI